MAGTRGGYRACRKINTGSLSLKIDADIFQGLSIRQTFLIGYVVSNPDASVSPYLPEHTDIQATRGLSSKFIDLQEPPRI